MNFDVVWGGAAVTAGTTGAAGTAAVLQSFVAAAVAVQQSFEAAAVAAQRSVVVVVAGVERSVVVVVVVVVVVAVNSISNFYSDICCSSRSLRIKRL
jgi:hypothetical protein